jgi:hypothetical protein
MHKDERVTDAMVEAGLRITLSSVGVPAGECLHETDVREIVTAALASAEEEKAVVPTANCCICGRVIDTREKSEGGDDFGAETAPGKWTCSMECDDKVTGYVPDVPAVEQETEFLHRLVENAFSWGKQDCNYLNPKHIEAFIAATRNGMLPESAGSWTAGGLRSSHRTHPPRSALVASPEANARAWHLGSMNDGLFIIDSLPRPSNDYVYEERQNGPSVVLKVSGLSNADAQAVCDAHNAALSRNSSTEETVGDAITAKGTP